MATEAQIAANRANAQRSTGPRTEAGKQAVAQNRLEHGLSGGAFRLLPWESAEEFEALQAGLRAEHQPETVTEQLLVDRLAEHEWLRRRAGYLQSLCASADGIIEDAASLPSICAIRPPTSAPFTNVSRTCSSSEPRSARRKLALNRSSAASASRPSKPNCARPASAW